MREEDDFPVTHSVEIACNDKQAKSDDAVTNCTRFASSCCEMLPLSTKAPASSWTVLGGMTLALPL